MSVPEFGQLELISPREFWRNEASDFTPWLAAPANIQRLAAELGIELEVEATERSVGPFSADIVCTASGSDYRVVIENQLERTDHDHLGKLLTYAAGIENTQAVVWLAARFTDEHRAALDWLNGVTSDFIRFFGVEVQVWRIGQSMPALKFEVVVKPNEWAKAIRSGGGEAAQSEHKQLQLKFWMGLRDYLSSIGSAIKFGSPRADTWATMSLGRSSVTLSAVVSSWDLAAQKEVAGVNRVELDIKDQIAAREYFAQLLARRDEIETKLGEALIWYEPPNTERTRKIFVQRNAPALSAVDSWPEQFEWLRQKTELLERVFRPLVRDLTLPRGDSLGR